MKYQTLKEAGYKYLNFDNNSKMHMLKNIETGSVEAWTANKNHASYGLIYKNTHLEFCYTLN